MRGTARTAGPRMLRVAMAVLCAGGVLAACSPSSTGLGLRATPLAPAPAGARQPECPTPTSCYALAADPADYHGVYHWDGAAWSRLPIDPPGGLYWMVDHLSCPADGVCFFAGNAGPDIERSRLLLARWDGTTVTDLTPAAESGSYALGLSCTSATWCMVLQNSRGGDHLLRWDGTSVAGTRAPPSRLWTGPLSCGAPTNCKVWSTGLDGSSPPKIAHWNGSEWSLASVVAGAAGGAVLAPPFDVSCSGPSFCAALAKAQAAVPNPPYISSRIVRSEAIVATWAGGAWSPFATVAPGAGVPARQPMDDLRSISCARPGWCLAHGTTWTTPADGVRQATAQVQVLWNGSAWYTDVGPTEARPEQHYAMACAPGSGWCLAAPVTDARYAGPTPPLAIIPTKR